MYGLDTNVLLRMVVGDDNEQQRKVIEFLNEHCSRHRVYISHVVLCEFVWVLTKVYQYKKHDILGAVKSLLKDEYIEFLCEDVFRSTLQLYEDSNIDFSDALIGFIYKNQGINHTITFDKKAAKSPMFKLI